MRIISGSHKGRNIIAPKNLPVRPTTDFAKEGLFNVLNNRIDFEGLKVLDLFSGIGSIAYEFASRGAAAVTAVDSHYNCVAFIKKTAETIKLEAIHAIKGEATAFLKNTTGRYDLIFADPPFEYDNYPGLRALVFEKGLLEEGGMLIIEHSSRTSLSKEEHFLERREYGKINFSIFGKKQTNEQ